MVDFGPIVDFIEYFTKRRQSQAIIVGIKENIVRINIFCENCFIIEPFYQNKKVGQQKIFEHVVTDGTSIFTNCWLTIYFCLII